MAGRRGGVGDLHLDSDYANLATPVLQPGDQVWCKLAQFRGQRAVRRGNAECALAQSQHMTVLREMRRHNMGEMLLQCRQRLHGIEQSAKFLIVAHQMLQTLWHGVMSTYER